MLKRKSVLFASMSILAGILFVTGCDRLGTNPVPPDGTGVTTTSEVFRAAANGLAGDCERIGGCTCILDGIQTTCPLVFACLDAGFCQLVKTR